jgi:hypothetical protein
VVVVEQRHQARCDVLDAHAEASKDVEEVVGVLVLTAAVEREGLQHDECAGPSNPNLATRLLSEDGGAVQYDPLPIDEREVESGGDDGSEVALDASDSAGSIVGSTGRDQKIHRDLRRPFDPPALPGRVAVLVRIHGEAGQPKALGQRLVAATVQDRQGQAHIEVRCPDMSTLAGIERFLVDEQRRCEASYNDRLVSEVAELRGHVEARGTHVDDLLG